MLKVKCVKVKALAETRHKSHKTVRLSPYPFHTMSVSMAHHHQTQQSRRPRWWCRPTSHLIYWSEWPMDRWPVGQEYDPREQKLKKWRTMALKAIIKELQRMFTLQIFWINSLLLKRISIFQKRIFSQRLTMNPSLETHPPHQQGFEALQKSVTSFQGISWQDSGQEFESPCELRMICNNHSISPLNFFLRQCKIRHSYLPPKYQ